MTTIRKQIRNEVARILNGVTVAGDKVFPSRARKLDPHELPAILVYTPSENISVYQVSPLEYERVLTVKIEIAIASNDDPDYPIDDQIDDIANVVEAALYKDDSLGGLVNSTTLKSVQTDISDEGEQLISGCVLTYEMEYNTEAVNDASGLDAFETAGITVRPNGATTTSPAAGSLSELEQ